MKISLNAVKEFVDFDLPIDELVEKLGAQLGAVDAVIDLGKKYQGIVIAKVVTCDPHPNADKLKICAIDDGVSTPDVKRDGNSLIQVVCGAPNARAGLMVAWLPPGATVPNTFDKEPFVLEAREIRGQVSNGMLASPKELDLGDSHDGILELDTDGDKPPIKPGDDFAKTYGLDDYIIEIENKMFTHRPDLFGQLGIAREVAGILGQPFKSPDVYTTPKIAGTTEGGSNLLEVKNELPELVPRFMAQVFQNVSIGPSPVWLQAYLSRVGIRPISNVVDITNYFMMLTGQPLHAYDYDKVKALDPAAEHATLAVRFPHDSEKLTLLSGKEITPRAETIMIATATLAIGLGGVMGGANTEVDSGTKNIILECASFNMYSIRRTSVAHGLFTDAVTRFTKGQSPLQNDRVMAWACEQLVTIAGALPDATVHDSNNLSQDIRQRDSLKPPVKVSQDFVNARLGLQLPIEQMKGLLENVEFNIEISGSDLAVTAPFWRTDIELREDVVEEIGRLYGYDKLPLVLPRRDLTPAAKNQLLELKSKIRGILSKAGANEVLTYSFVHGNLLDKVGQDRGKAFQVSNALSPDLQYYRLSLMPSLLDKVHQNIKAGYDEFALFELGRTHSLDNPTDNDDVPEEFEFTALVVAASDKLKKTGAAYFQARKYLENLVGRGNLVFKPVSEAMRGYPVVQPYDLNRAALVSLKDGTFLGIIGEFKPTVSRALKLPKYTAGFEIDTTVLQSMLAAGPTYAPISRFPKIIQDITFKVSGDLAYQEVYDFILDQVNKIQPTGTRTQLEPIDIYQPDSDSKHITFRLAITSYSRTLTDTEINKLLNAVAASAKTKFNAQRL